MGLTCHKHSHLNWIEGYRQQLKFGSWVHQDFPNGQTTDSDEPQEIPLDKSLFEAHHQRVELKETENSSLKIFIRSHFSPTGTVEIAIDGS